MKLNEIFYFGREQALADFTAALEPEPDYDNTDELSPGDFIISRFENRKISYEEAYEELIKNNLSEWIHELNMADELRKLAKKLN